MSDTLERATASYLELLVNRNLEKVLDASFDRAGLSGLIDVFEHISDARKEALRTDSSKGAVSEFYRQLDKAILPALLDRVKQG